MPKHHALKS